MCPECNHTMSNLGMDSATRRVFWCPRCGTLKTEIKGVFVVIGGGSTPGIREEHEAPFLVHRSRNLIAMLEKVALPTRVQISADAVSDSIKGGQ